MKRRIAKKIAGPPAGAMLMNPWLNCLRMASMFGARLNPPLFKILRARQKMGYDGASLTKSQYQEWIASQ